MATSRRASTVQNLQHNSWDRADCHEPASSEMQRPRLGSMIGSSSHARRRSSTFVDVWHSGSMTKLLSGVGGGYITEEQDSDTEPLLGKAKQRASQK